MAIVPSEPPSLYDAKTGRRRPLTAEEHRAHTESLRRALEAIDTITDETDTDAVWDRVERMLAERP